MSQTPFEATDLVADGCLRVRDAVKFLGVGKSTIYKLMDDGHLAYAKIGRTRLIPKRALVELAARNVSGGWNQ